MIFFIVSNKVFINVVVVNDVAFVGNITVVVTFHDFHGIDFIFLLHLFMINLNCSIVNVDVFCH